VKPPIPYFGNKRKVATEVWRRFGAVDRYIEPFFGSGAVLLGRPEKLREPQDVEIVNDLDGLLVNAYRAVKLRPEETTRYCCWPVTELDLVARSNWLAQHRQAIVARLRRDPEWCSPKAGGWWLWGACCWFGRDFAVSKTRKAKMPEVSRASRGLVGNPEAGTILAGLSHRLGKVHVATGDWARVLTPAVLGRPGQTVGVFLDPPYGAADERTGAVYQAEEADVGVAAREWALAHGEQKNLKIALCGYEGEHDMPGTWQVFAWEGHGAYGRGRGVGLGMENRHRERIWFSPRCLQGNSKAWYET
jgi:DNA adenine methylase